MPEARLPTDAPQTFVLVHGACHGGWCWARVAPILERAGHRVLTPTCGGVGERSGELTPQTGLDSFIGDIAEVLVAQDVSNAVLVGHSFGGCIISGVADQMPERLAQLIFLDAMVVQSGEAPMSILAGEVVEARRRAAALSPGGLCMPAPSASAFAVTDPADAEWVERHLTPHPIKTYEDRLVLRHPLGNGLPKTYVACTRPEFSATAPVRRWVREQAGWSCREIATGHDAMVLAPALLADLFMAIAAGRM